MISQYKINRINAILTARGVFAGTQSRAAMWQHVSNIDLSQLTSNQIADIIEAANKAYHQGKTSSGAEVVDDCVYVGDKLIPMAAINAITIERTIEHIPAKPYHWNPVFRGPSQESVTKYRLAYTERC